MQSRDEDDNIIRSFHDLSQDELMDKIRQEMMDPNVAKVTVQKERKPQDPVVPKFSNKGRKR